MWVLVGVGLERCAVLIELLVRPFEYREFGPGPRLGAYRVLHPLLEKLWLKVVGGHQLFGKGGEQ